MCQFTGYQGRTVTYELCVLSDEMKRCITENISHSDMLNYALNEGMVPLAEHMICLVASGTISFNDFIAHI
jgi:type II secretory ATPase GspE/PulE/Tfp pilus assembly ATPase PilB-like protein